MSIHDFYDRIREKYWRKVEEERRKLWEEEIKLEEEWRKWEEGGRKYFGWEAMQSEPTVDQIKEINWFPVRQKWCSIEKSLGISKGVMEEVIRTTVPFPENHLNSLCDIHACHIKAMLIKWLNKDQGTGNSERTWITIAKAVKKAGLEEVAFKLLVEVVKNALKHDYGIQFELPILHDTPTLQELRETVVHHLGDKWRRVGVSLGLSSKVMKEIDSKFGSVPTQCSEAMFSKWLNHEEGTGDKERTWGTVLTALVDAGRGDLVISVLDDLIVKHEAPNIDDIRVLVIPHVLLMWRVLGLQLGIHEAILSAIESDARRNRRILSKQAIEMFQLWLDGAEGTGDQGRSWSTILKALIEIGLSEVSIKVLKHFDPTATPKDIGRALSQLSENTQSLLDDIATFLSDPGPMTSAPALTTSTPVPTTPQVTAETYLKCPSFNDNVGQVSLLDCIEDEEVKKDKGCCSKSLSESSGSEVYTVPLPRLGSKRSCSVRDMGESSHATVEESTPTHHPPRFNGDHSTWSEPKRRHLEEGHSGMHPPDQPGYSGQKRSPTSGDLEESGHKKRSYDNVSVNAVIRKITRKKLHGGIMGMLNGQRIRLLHDDWKLINQKCKNSILGYLEKRNEIEEAADQLIDYFQKTHAGKQLLMFTRFLREEAEDDGQNPQLLNLAKSIEQAVRSLLLEDQ